MSYSPKNCPAGESTRDAEYHERVTVHVTTYVDNKPQLLKVITRVVMIDEGKRYITYDRKRYQLKKLRWHKDFYELRLVQ